MLFQAVNAHDGTHKKSYVYIAVKSSAPPTSEIWGLEAKAGGPCF